MVAVHRILARTILLIDRCQQAGISVPHANGQYLSSKSYVTVDWARLSKSYDSTFGTRTTTGGSRAPTVQGVWNRLVDFVTANFQREFQRSDTSAQMLDDTLTSRTSFLLGWLCAGRPSRLDLDHGLMLSERDQSEGVKPQIAVCSLEGGGKSSGASRCWSRTQIWT